MIRSHPLEVAGVIKTGEGIVRPAMRCHRIGQLTGLQVCSFLEHEMLKKMRDPGLSWWFIGRSNFVPDHMHNHRRAVVLNHHDLHAIAQHEVCGFALGQSLHW